MPRLFVKCHDKPVLRSRRAIRSGESLEYRSFDDSYWPNRSVLSFYDRQGVVKRIEDVKLDLFESSFSGVLTERDFVAFSTETVDYTAFIFSIFIPSVKKTKKRPYVPLEWDKDALSYIEKIILDQFEVKGGAVDIYRISYSPTRSGSNIISTSDEFFWLLSARKSCFVGHSAQSELLLEFGFAKICR